MVASLTVELFQHILWTVLLSNFRLWVMGRGGGCGSLTGKFFWQCQYQIKATIVTVKKLDIDNSCLNPIRTDFLKLFCSTAGWKKHIGSWEQNFNSTGGFYSSLERYFLKGHLKVWRLFLLCRMSLEPQGWANNVPEYTSLFQG
jgi:hypothetical protein